MKLRWGLRADQARADAPVVYAEAYETAVVHCAPSRNRRVEKQPGPTPGFGRGPRVGAT